MRFTITDELPYPLDLVFSTHRDKLEELIDYFPNVDSVETRSRVQVGDVVTLENHWRGASSDIPAVIRPFFKSELLAWTDRAEWDYGNRRCRWSIDLDAIPGAITARGENVFREEDGETIIDMSGEFIVHPERVPGIPTFLAKRAVPAIERFIVGLLQPNLRRSNAAVVEYIDDTY